MDKRLEQALALVNAVTTELVQADSRYIESVQRQTARIEEHVYNFDRYLDKIKVDNEEQNK